jgi:haloacid dehalogenase superfamily, subfamily IA, variant 3 with third motif having DD or ED/haloacid dehalogenase superfamily, subfamily IA, variant 1 with third motif having Dx(3-4)D or Dx(3-4)E
MNYSAVVFDMDGTILNTLDDLAAATNFALEANRLPLRTTEDVRRFVGNGVRRLVERAVPGETPPSVMDAVYADFSAYYAKHCADRTKPYDGMKELLSRLRTAGIKTAVVSNKDDYAVQTLARVYFPALFDAVVGVREGIKKKPAPDTVYEVMARLAVGKEQCIYVGDSEVDIETARNAGIPCVSVSWGFKGRPFLQEHNAVTIVDTAAELSAVLMCRSPCEP